MSDKSTSGLREAEVVGSDDYIYSIVSGNSRRVRAANFFKNIASAFYDTLALADDAADFLPVYDDSAGVWKKVLGKNLGFTQAGTGAGLRSLQSKLRDSPSVKDFAATGDGTTPDQAAFSAAAAAFNYVYVPPGTYRISANTALPSTTRWIVADGALFSIDSGVTLTFRGEVASGWAQIFSGSGTVTGLKRVRAEWFGAAADGATDDRGAIQKAQDSMEASGSSRGSVATLEFDNKTYAVGSQINFTPTNAFKMCWVGAGSQGNPGTRLKGLASFSGTSVLKVIGAGQTGCDFLFRDFSIRPQTNGSGPARGITIGDVTSSRLNGGTYAVPAFENVDCSEFAISWYARNARQIRFIGCSGWQEGLADSRGIRLQSNDSNDFTGDMTFIGMQLVGHAAGGGATLDITCTAGAIHGLRFNDLIGYYAPVNVVADTGGIIGDVWFNPGCQLDALVGSGFVVGAGDSNSVLEDLHIRGLYISGGGSTAQINGFVVGSGKARGIHIDGNWQKSAASAPAAQFSGWTDFSYCGNQLEDMAIGAGALVKFASCVDFRADGNQAFRADYAGSFPNLLSFDAACASFSAIGNEDRGLSSSAIISDSTSSSTAKVIVGSRGTPFVPGISTDADGTAAAGGFTISPRLVPTGAAPAQVSTDGTDATPVVTEVYIAEVFVPANMTLTGVALMNGSVASGNIKLGLANSAGAVVATSASTAMSGTDAYQRVPFTSAYAAKGPATYYVLLFVDNTTARFNTHTFGNFGAAKQTGQVYATGFTTITPPTTFTTALGPIASLY